MGRTGDLPQLDGDLFLTDGGIETFLIFKRGIELPEFAAFDLLKDDQGTEELRSYYLPYLELAKEHGRTQMCMAHLQRREQHLVDGPNDNGPGQVALSVLRRPAARLPPLWIVIVPQDLEACQADCRAIIYGDVAGDPQHHGRAILVIGKGALHRFDHSPVDLCGRSPCR